MHTVSFDGFLTFVLQQYKDKDTIDGLQMAFKTLAGGKESLPEKDLAEFLKPTDAEFLRPRLRDMGDDSYAYGPYVAGIYGQGAPVEAN